MRFYCKNCKSVVQNPQDHRKLGHFVRVIQDDMKEKNSRNVQKYQKEIQDL